MIKLLDQKKYLTNIKFLLKTNQIEQKELAKLIGLKVTTMNMKLIGNRRITLEEAIKISKVFDKSVEEIFLTNDDT